MTATSPRRARFFVTNPATWRVSDRAADTRLTGCCCLYGGMDRFLGRCPPGSPRCHWVGSDHGLILVGTLSSDSPTPSPSSLCVRRMPLFQVGGEGRRCSLLVGCSGCCGLRSRGLPRLERGLVRVRVRVTLDDGGHRYSQREQLMSDHSHDQVTVPNNLQDKRIGVTASANSDGRHETDERIRSEDPLLATDRLSQHTHVQQVAQGIPVDVLGVVRC